MTAKRVSPPDDAPSPRDVASRGPTVAKQSNSAGTADRWYRDGLRFECTQCGGCCSGEPGFVWVDDAERRAMAEQLGLTIENFEHQFTRRVGRRTSLKEYPDGDCIFLEPDSRRCLVYQSRPTQCRTWPFWNSTVGTPADWRDTCDVCPGAGTGRLYSIEEIEVRRGEKSV